MYKLLQEMEGIIAELAKEIEYKIGIYRLPELMEINLIDLLISIQVIDKTTEEGENPF